MLKKEQDRILDLILNQLEIVNKNQKQLSKEIQKTNIQLTKISNFKSWKENIDKIINIDDLAKIKEFYNKHQDIDSDVIDLYLITKELRDSSDDYNKFKTKILTILGIISFVFATIITAILRFVKI